MRTASPELVTLLAGSLQFVMWETFTFTLPDGTEIVYTTRDPDAPPIITPTSALLWLQDTFTGTEGTTLVTHAGEIGANWTASSGLLTNFELDGNGAMRYAVAGGGSVNASGLPGEGASDYFFEAIVVIQSAPTGAGTTLAEFYAGNLDTESGWVLQASVVSGAANISTSAYFFGPDGSGDVIPLADTGIALSGDAVTLRVDISLSRTQAVFFANEVELGSVDIDVGLDTADYFGMTFATGQGGDPVAVLSVVGGYL